jgi:cytochrome b561
VAQAGPDLHKSIGLVLLAVMLLRDLAFHQPATAGTGQPWRGDAPGAKLGHLALYLGLFAVMIAGYLISTADGVGIPVFGLFEVPALISDLPDQADVPGSFICGWHGAW